MRKLFVLSHALLFFILMPVSGAVMAGDLSQIAPVDTALTPQAPMAHDQPKVGRMLLFTPDAAIRWANRHKSDPLARLVVYVNPNLKTAQQVFTWWRLQKDLKAQADADLLNARKEKKKVDSNAE